MKRVRKYIRGKREKTPKERDYKQALIFSRHVQFTKAEMAKCAAWLAIASANEVKTKQAPIFQQWSRMGQKKVVLRVENVEQLEKIEEECKKRKIVVLRAPTSLLEGKNEELYALGIGPQNENVINQVVGHLKLI
ncbi:MAG: peptidyl-tRNA hydrolase [Candidatus Hodarchaeota archaeon]